MDTLKLTPDACAHTVMETVPIIEAIVSNA